MLIFSVVFLVIGVLNMILVHPVPGILYFLLSLLYIPWTNDALKEKIDLKIHSSVKVVLAFVVIWGTLAIGDLAEILGL